MTHRWVGRSAALACALAGIASAQTTESIYTNSLASGWENWSWGSTINFANASPARGGSGTSISVQYTTGWAGLYLHSANLIDLSTRPTLRFAIHGGPTGGQQIRLVPYNASLGEGTSVTITPAPAAGVWTVVSIPTSSFNLTQLSGLVWQENSGGVPSTYYLDDIEWILGEPPPPGPGPAITVDASHVTGRISPLIYGINYGSSQLAADTRTTIRRWGGNATTRYNWQLDVSNRASDWYFENIPEPTSTPQNLPNDSSADQFVEFNRSLSIDSLITVPLIGWTPKARAYACGFSVTKYGAQQSVDPYRPDCGNGVRTNGTLVTGNDPLDTSIAIGPAFVQGWINHLTSRYGLAGAGGVRFYNLDNEPMLWNSTHRDVHPAPASYDELRDRTLQYAPAIKAADPGAKTLGPVFWGWTAYFWSALDIAAGGAWWNNPPDRLAHGNMPLVEWYLQQMQAYEQSHGLRILDYLDLHYYPQTGVSLTSAGDAARQAKRLECTRSLWDPTYVDGSWITDPVKLIPRMRDWVNTRYPGTLLALTEYNWGGLEDINGALAQADVLGIFGREGLDLATLWDPPTATQPGAFAFRMYRNYDGAGAAFGDRRVTATSQNQGQVSVYAARTPGNRLTLILINKQTTATTSNLTVSGFWPAGAATVYRYSSANLGAIVHEADVSIASPVSLTLPASSITLLTAAGATSPADHDADGDVDATDFTSWTACATRSQVAVAPLCAWADLDTDGDADLDDFARIQRCLAGDGVAVSPVCAQ